MVLSSLRTDSLKGYFRGTSWLQVLLLGDSYRGWRAKLPSGTRAPPGWAPVSLWTWASVGPWRSSIYQGVTCSPRVRPWPNGGGNWGRGLHMLKDPGSEIQAAEGRWVAVPEAGGVNNRHWRWPQWLTVCRGDWRTAGFNVLDQQDPCTRSFDLG